MPRPSQNGKGQGQSEKQRDHWVFIVNSKWNLVFVFVCLRYLSSNQIQGLVYMRYLSLNQIQGLVYMKYLTLNYIQDLVYMRYASLYKESCIHNKSQLKLDMRCIHIRYLTIANKAGIEITANRFDHQQQEVFFKKYIQHIVVCVTFRGYYFTE